ncbi:hypothetical protein ACJ41O_011007 [Fusarium nematophilum]
MITYHRSSVDLATLGSLYGNRVAYTEKGTLKESFDKLDVPTGLCASILVSLATVDSGAWLSYFKDSHALESSLAHTVEVSHEAVNLSGEESREHVNVEALQNKDATHVVSGIRWGARSVVSARSEPPEGQEPSDNASIRDTLQQVLRSIGEQDPGPSGEPSKEAQELANSLEFKIYSDIEGSERRLDYAGIRKFLSTIPEAIQNSSSGKGSPITYELVPIEEAARKLGREIKPPIIQPLSQDSLDKIVRIFETLYRTEQDLNDHVRACDKHAFCVPEGHLQGVLGELERWKSFEPGIKSLLSELVVMVRRGEPELSRLVPGLDEIRQSLDGGGILSSVANYNEKMAFAYGVPSKETHYLPDNPEAIAKFLRDRRAQSHHILHYNAASIAHPLWKDTRNKFMELALSRDTTDSVVVAVDCDMGEQRPLPKPCITSFRSGLCTIPDLVAATHELAGKSILRCRVAGNVKKMTGSEPPDEQRPVRIACPGPRCSSTKALDWICEHCMEIVHFGIVDEYMYCRCGRYKFFDAEFRCNQSTHGPEFRRCTNKYMLYAMLERLPPCEEHNILVVGEVGAGKSTFINTFINSIVYDSWSEAREDPELRYAAPCSFSFEEKTEDGESKTHDIQVGQESDSVARTTGTYVLKMNGKVIRIIETSGIGSPEGITRDCDIIKDLLKTLEHVDSISTILFLVNPDGNASAIDYWFTEFLSRLHQEVKRNIIFGFTNSPSSGSPMDLILATMLDKRNISIDIQDLKTPFYFSSIPFRYLAAKKLHGLDMGDNATVKNNWDENAQQVRRLVNRTVGARRHRTKKTLSVNLVRSLIFAITKPLNNAGKRTPELEKIKDVLGRVSGTAHEVEPRQAQAKLNKVVDHELKKALSLLCSHIQHNACVPFNDATIPYLQELHRERKKDAKLLGEQLDKCRLERHHLEQLFKDSKAESPNESKLVDVIESLYLLEMVGKDLEDVVRGYSAGRVSQRARQVALGPSGTTLYEWMERS